MHAVIFLNVIIITLHYIENIRIIHRIKFPAQTYIICYDVCIATIYIYIYFSKLMF